MEMQEFTNNDPDHTGEADDNTSDLQTVTAPEDNHQVSSDNTGEDKTSGEDTSPTSDLQIQTSEVSADNTNEASTSTAAVKTKQDLNTLVEEKSKEKKVRPDYTQYEKIGEI